MNLFSEACEGALVVHVQEARLDAAVAIGFKEKMREVTLQPGARVLLDMSQIMFLDSSGLGSVVSVMKALAPKRSLELCSLSPNVAKVFRLTRMETVFPIHANVAAALEKGPNYA